MLQGLLNEVVVVHSSLFLLSTIPLNMHSQNEIALLIWLKGAGDDTVLSRLQPHPDVGLTAVLPGRSLGYAAVAAVVPPVLKELRRELLGIVLHLVDFEPNLKEGNKAK